MDSLEGRKQAGSFRIAPDRDIYGELTVSGRDTSLYLRDPSFFHTRGIPDGCIHGALYDLTKVSLFGCITTQGPGTQSGYSERYNFSTVFPHFVIHGDRYLSPSEEVITRADFVIDDAMTLFYDFDAFGRMIDARPFIDKLVNSQAEAAGRSIEVGPNPEILYFTGKTQIFSAETGIGRISAAHGPGGNFGGPRGLSLPNTIFVTIEFSDPITFDAATDHILAVLRYFELLIGRRQNLTRLIIATSLEEQSRSFEVYWSLRPARGPESEKSREPHPIDVLLDAIDEPAEFSSVLTKWLARQSSWHEPRLRFWSSFGERGYEIDRIVAAANMFDILPDTAMPTTGALPSDLQQAKERCRDIFKSLPPSPERDSVLSSLGRVGRSSLKQKIRHRNTIVSEKLPERFPELSLVTDEAVNCRNHFVHGSPAAFDYSHHFRTFAFLIDALEFVFAASDLIECGWNIDRWVKRGTTGSHPFGAFRAEYLQNLDLLKKQLPASQ